jgi:hypothetical protein
MPRGNYSTNRAFRAVAIGMLIMIVISAATLVANLMD